jgi:cation transport ATPase
MVGIGRAQNGILFKNATALEQTSKVGAIIFDKTDADARQPEVTDIVIASLPTTSSGLLKLVASIEQASEHPLAQAIVAKAKQKSSSSPNSQL